MMLCSSVVAVGVAAVLPQFRPGLADETTTQVEEDASHRMALEAWRPGASSFHGFRTAVAQML